MDEAKNQKEAGLRNGEEKISNVICEPSDPALPDTTYSPSFSVHEPINLFQVGFLSLEIERALANTQGHCKNTVGKKRPQKIHPRGGQNRKRKREGWIQQAARQSEKTTRLREHQGLCSSSTIYQ